MTESQNQTGDREEQSFNLYDFLNILRKRWPVIVAVLIAVSCVGIFKTMQQTYMYMATSKLAFSAPDPQLLISGGSSWANSMMNRQTYFPTQLEFIKSEPVARRVVEALGLAKDPNNQKQVESLTWMVLGSIQVRSLKETDIITISSTSQNPELAMKIANATAEAYIRYNDDKRFLSYRKSMGGITEQLADLEKKLEETQKDLITFIEKEKITSYGDGIQTYDSNPGRDAEKEVRSFAENLNNQKVQAEIELAKLKDRYFDDHPKIVNLKSDLKILNDKIGEENTRLAALKSQKEKEIIEAKQKEIRYSILKRKVEVNKQLYDTLIKKLKETDVGSSIDTNFIDIIEYAKLPAYPFGPNKNRQVFFSIFLGLFLGLVVGVAMQYFDTSFAKVEDIENLIKYPVFASIPFIKRKDKKGNLILGMFDDDSNLKEAFRLLRTNLRFALSEKPGKQLIITSSQKGEGKSTVTANLGIIMAEAGAKTLLVDCDFRMHSLKKIFGVTSDKGLSDYLHGEADLESISVKTTIQDLFVVSSGGNVDNPSILFESENMKIFIQEAGKQYDYVLFDSPPVGYVIDASLLGLYTDGIVMVVEAGGVGRKTVKKAVEQLLKGKSHIYGIVFNKESFNKKSYYYKYYNYYSKESEKTV